MDEDWKKNIEIEIITLKEGYKAISQMRDLLSEMNNKLGTLIVRMDFSARSLDSVEQEAKTVMSLESQIKQLVAWLCGTGSHDIGLKNRVTLLEQERAKQLGWMTAAGAIGTLIGGIIAFAASNHSWLFGKGIL